MSSIPLKSIKGKERETLPPDPSTSTSCAPPSAVPLISAHHTEIESHVFTERAQEMIRERWKCDGDGKIVCFRAPGIERFLTDEDIEAWARELASHNATLAQPPPLLLSKWTQDVVSDIPLTIGRCLHNSFALDSMHSASTSSFSSSDYSVDITCFDGIGSFTGSGVKGIGNIIIRGITIVDTRYRTAKVRNWLKLMYSLHRKTRKRAFHRLILGLVAPRKQLNGLLNEIWDDMQSRWYILYLTRIITLANILDNQCVPLSPYLSMKWLRIHQYCRGLSSFAAVDSVLFLEDYDTEEEALAHARRILQESYATKLDMSFASEEDVQARFHAQVFLSRISGGNVFPSWNSTWKFATFVKAPRLLRSTPSRQISELLECLSSLVVWDTDMAFDAPPSSRYSIWGATCRLLSECMSRHKPVTLWEHEYSYVMGSVDNLLWIVSETCSTRRPTLRSANTVMRLMEAIPDRIWNGTSKGLFLMRNLWSLAVDGDIRKAIGLRLARDFMEGDVVRDLVGDREVCQCLVRDAKTELHARRRRGSASRL